METKRLVIGMLLAMAVVFGWQIGVGYLAKKYNWTLGTPSATQPAVVATTTASTQEAASATTQAAGTPPASAPAVVSVPAVTSAPAGAVQIATTQPGRAVQLGIATLTKGLKEPSPYPLGVEISPFGAGIESVVLNQFTKSVPLKGESPEPYTYQRPYAAHPELSRPLATRSVSINGRPVDLAAVKWVLAAGEGEGQNSATYYVDLESATGKLRVWKTYELQRGETQSKGYEMLVRYRFENRGEEALKVSAMFNGPTVPSAEFPSETPQVIAGYWDVDQVKVGHDMAASFGPKMPSKDLTKLENKMPVLWAGTSSAYFDAIVRPEFKEGKFPNYVASVQATALDPNAPPGEHDIVVTFQTTELEVPAGVGQSVEIPLYVFFGPKMRAVVKSDYYAAIPRCYHETLGTLASGCSNWCTFGWLIGGMVWLLSFFHAIFRDWGLAIIGLVVVVRLLLHPLTKRSTISMQKMGKMGPEMERLKKKYGDNKEELNKAMWEFQKQQGMTPILGCLPMFLQMPIWVALWQSLQSTFELRQAPFLWGFTWIKDLSQADKLIDFGHSIPLVFGMSFSAINALPILLAIVFYLQQRYTPKPPATTPEQEQQQKMMQWMSLLFPVMFYGMPSGLNLYILTSTTIGIIESKRIRDHIKQREEAEKAGKVIVETKPTRASKLKGREKDDGKKTGLAGWIATLADKADQIRRNADKRK